MVPWRLRPTTRRTSKVSAARVLPTATNPDDEVAVLDRAGIAWRIRRLRTDRGWSQTDLGDACDTDKHVISTWERARKCPSLTMLLRLADAFACRVDYIVRGWS